MTSSLSLKEYRALTEPEKKRSKYNAKKATRGDITFDSEMEARRYDQLMELFKQGYIRNLELQPSFPIIIGNQKMFTYRADFVYFEGALRVIEDVKGFKTPLYRLKKKIVEAMLHVTIREVKA